MLPEELPLHRFFVLFGSAFVLPVVVRGPGGFGLAGVVFAVRVVIFSQHG